MEKKRERSKTDEEATERLKQALKRLNKLAKEHGKTSPKKEDDNQESNSNP